MAYNVRYTPQGGLRFHSFASDTIELVSALVPHSSLFYASVPFRKTTAKTSRFLPTGCANRPWLCQSWKPPKYAPALCWRLGREGMETQTSLWHTTWGIHHREDYGSIPSLSATAGHLSCNPWHVSAQNMCWTVRRKTMETQSSLRGKHHREDWVSITIPFLYLQRRHI